MRFSRSRNLVGLDIGDHAIKVVEVREKGRGQGFTLSTLATEPLSSEAIVDGSIMDAGLVIETIQKIWKEHRLKNSQVALALSGHSVIIKRVSLPVMNQEELAESISWEAETYIPFDIDDVNIDYQVLEGSSLAGEGNMDVLLVAVKKETINDYTSVISQAGLTPVVADVDAFALQTCYESNYDVEAGKTVALVDIGASVTTISILQGGASVFWRDLSVGGNQYTDAIQKELNLSSEQAERLKRGEEAEGIPFDNVVPILSAVSQELADGIQKTVDFFKATAASDEGLDAMYLTGGTSKIPRLRESLEERFGCPVEHLDPFRRVNPGGGLSREDMAAAAPSAAIALGLGVRSAGDKKINLLGEGRPGKAAKAPGKARLEAGGWKGWALAGVFLLALAFVGEEWWRLGAKLSAHKETKANLEQELQQLQKDLERVQELEKKKASKERRFNLLKELKNNKQVPVYVLQQVNDAFGQINQGEVQSIWLELLSENRQKLSLRGRANTFHDVSELWNRLNENPVFADVLLGQTVKEGDSIRFTVDAMILPESILSEEGEAMAGVWTGGAPAAQE